ncbi:MAG: hypothetical protein LC121_11075 [Anaerolineae bacterium]|nr:hypothetical protein [Anaerolineae bacterium]
MTLLADEALHQPTDIVAAPASTMPRRRELPQRGIRQPIHENRVKQIDSLAVQPYADSGRQPDADGEDQQRRIFRALGMKKQTYPA